jgi:hypothetical protein
LNLNSRFQFNLPGALIDFFKKPEAKNIVNFKRGPDELLRYRLEREVLFPRLLYLCFICVNLWLKFFSPRRPPNPERPAKLFQRFQGVSLGFCAHKFLATDLHR